MANIPSADKRNRQRLTRRARNLHRLTTMRTLVKRVRAAIAEVIAEGKVRTYDMGGSATTMDVAKAVAAKL